MGNNVVVLEKPASKVVVGGPSFSTAAWSDIQGKPDTFPPSTHNHDTEYDALGAATTAQAAAIAASAPADHVGAGGSEHANAVAAGASGFMTGADKSKLDSIAPSANNYTHPANHSTSIITQDANNRFVSDTEKATWNGKASPADITAAITAAINGLVDASPGTLDTLNELAAALGDDPNFATTIASALAGKATPAQIATAVQSHVDATDPHAQYAKEADLGSMAGQNANAVNIGGGAIDATPIGQSVPAAGDFTTLRAHSRIIVDQRAPTLILNETDASGYNWAMVGNNQVWGDLVFRRSTAPLGDPVTAGVPVISLSEAGLAVSGALTASEGVVVQGGWSNTNPNPVAEADYAGCSYKWRVVNPSASSTVWEAKLVQTSGSYVDQGDLVFKHHYSGEVARLTAGGISVSGALTTSGDINIVRQGANAAVGIESAGGAGRKLYLISKNDGAFGVFDGTEGKERLLIDASGNLLVGATHPRPGVNLFQVGDTLGVTVADNNWFQAANAANTCLRVGVMATGRSISTPGTINASGADYAEYERNNGLAFAKGDIVGFAADGTLTNVFEYAIRFAVKSTNPSYVGGDTWGSEAQVGTRPEMPVYTAPDYVGVPKPVAPIKLDSASEEEVNTEADDAEYLEAINGYQDQLRLWEAAQDSHQIKVMVAESFHAAAVAQYEVDIQIFEAKLEAARQSVDRVAYSGKVPCNVMGAIPGGYIIAVESEDGGIKGEFVADPDFSQYKKAVGRVNRILEDGRCEVAVMVH